MVVIKAHTSSGMIFILINFFLLLLLLLLDISFWLKSQHLH